MRLKIKGKEIQLNNAEARACRKQISRMLKSIRKASRLRGRVSYYFTFLLMMHMMSANYINEMDIDSLEFIMNNQFDLLSQKEQTPRILDKLEEKEEDL